MKIVAITQARCGSTRLPKKVLKKINRKTLLEIHVERIKTSSKITDFWVATTIEPDDQKIVQICDSNGINCYCGSEEDVLDRFYQCAVNVEPDYVVRLTSDCPLIDSFLIDEVVQMTVENELDYGANVWGDAFPDGQDVEVIKFSALKYAWERAEKVIEREHVTPYITKNSNLNGKTLFKAMNYPCKEKLSQIRMTVDEPADLETIKILIKYLGKNKSWKDYAYYIKSHPEKFLNQGNFRGLPNYKSIKTDPNNG